jgi:CBS domain-containing protein
MATVQDILNVKGSKVFSVPPTGTVMDALKEMAENGCGAVLVMDGEKALGIFSERDYARRVKLMDKKEDTGIKDVMTKAIYYVSPQSTVEECMAQMTDKHIRHLPVVHEGKVIGVISIGDVVKDIISHQQFLIKSLENYIMGKDYNQ